MTPGTEAALREACKPWEYSTGEPPEWENPLRGVFEAGITYAVQRLARMLHVESYEGGDGEELNEALDRELANVMRAAGFEDQEGDLLTRESLAAERAALAPPSPGAEGGA